MGVPTAEEAVCRAVPGLAAGLGQSFGWVLMPGGGGSSGVPLFFGYGSKLGHQRPLALVFLSSCQGNPFWEPTFEPHFA